MIQNILIGNLQTSWSTCILLKPTLGGQERSMIYVVPWVNKKVNLGCSFYPCLNGIRGNIKFVKSIMRTKIRYISFHSIQKLKIIDTPFDIKIFLYPLLLKVYPP